MKLGNIWVQGDYEWGGRTETLEGARARAATYVESQPGSRCRFIVLHQFAHAPELPTTWLGFKVERQVNGALSASGRRVRSVRRYETMMNGVVGEIVGASGFDHELGECAGCTQAWRVANGDGADVSDMEEQT